MTSSVASESMPMSRPPGPAPNGLATPDNTAARTQRRVPARCLAGHEGQALSSPRTSGIPWWSRRWREDRTQLCLRLLMCGLSRHNAAAAPRRPKPARAHQRRVRWRMVAVPAPEREMDCDTETTPNLGLQCRWEFSSGHRCDHRVGLRSLFAASPPARDGVSLETPTSFAWSCDGLDHQQDPELPEQSAGATSS
jgi:hypothetical protein